MDLIVNLPSQSVSVESVQAPQHRRPWVTPEFKEIDLRSARFGASMGGSDAVGSND